MLSNNIKEYRTSSPINALSQSMTLPEISTAYSPSVSPRVRHFSLELLETLRCLQKKEEEFLKQTYPALTFSDKDCKVMFSELLQTIQTPLMPSKIQLALPAMSSELLLKQDSLLSEIHKQGLEISKLRSDNRLLAFELESLQNEIKLQKLKNQNSQKSELLRKKGELVSKLKAKSQELDRKKILALELQKELGLIQTSNQNLKNYLYEMRKIYGNLDLKAKNIDSGPSIRRNRSQDFKSISNQ